jgi:hypothetical protein
MSNNKQPTFFMYGLSASGKDTLANHLYENYGYSKIRIAKTIKQVVCETNNMTPEILEIQKRLNQNLRYQHKEVSDYMESLTSNKKHNLNRLKMLIDGTSYDYELLTKKQIDNPAPKVFIDIRGFDEAHMLLKSGAIGIFLKRGGDNNTNKGHWTENGMFATNRKGVSDMTKLFKEFGNQCYIVDNSESNEVLIPTSNFLQFDKIKVTGEMLIEEVDEKIFRNLIK